MSSVTCTALTSRGEPCRRKPVLGSDRCGRHAEVEAADADAPFSGAEVSAPLLQWLDEWLSSVPIPAEAVTEIRRWFWDQQLRTPEAVACVQQQHFPPQWVLGWSLPLARAVSALGPLTLSSTADTTRTVKRRRDADESDSDGDDAGKPAHPVVSTYELVSVDGVSFFCSVKAEGVKRLTFLRFVARVMSPTRVQILFPDLVWDPVTVKSLIIFHSESLITGADTALSPLANAWRLSELPAYSSSAKFERLLLGKSEVYNWDALSLFDFVAVRAVPSWDRQPTRHGRGVMEQALINRELCMTILFDSAFEGSLAAMRRVFTMASEPLKFYHDLFIIAKIEHVFVSWTLDVRLQRRSLLFPAIDLGTPGGCATLLRCYVALWVTGVTGEALEAAVVVASGIAPPTTSVGAEVCAVVTRQLVEPWERAPHTLFYGEDGVAGQIRLPSATPRPRVESTAAAGLATAAPKSESKLCLYAALQMAGAKTREGVLWACHKGSACPKRHVASRDELKGPDFNQLCESCPQRFKSLLMTALGGKQPPEQPTVSVGAATRQPSSR